MNPGNSDYQRRVLREELRAQRSSAAAPSATPAEGDLVADPAAKMAAEKELTQHAAELEFIHLGATAVAEFIELWQSGTCDANAHAQLAYVVS